MVRRLCARFQWFQEVEQWWLARPLEEVCAGWRDVGGERRLA